MKTHTEDFESFFSREILKPLKRAYGFTSAELWGYKVMRDFLNQIWRMTVVENRRSRSKKEDPKISVHFCGKTVSFHTKTHKLSIEKIWTKWDTLIVGPSYKRK